MQRDADLLHVSRSFHSQRQSLGRQQQADEYGDNTEGHEQFDERKIVLAFHDALPYAI
jgi:hypothetical protein